METKNNQEQMEKSKTELLNSLKEMNISLDNLDWVGKQLDQTINEEIERQNKDEQTQVDTLPDQALSDLENLEYLYTMYKRTVERGKPNQRMAEQLKKYIDIIQIESYE